MHKFFSRIDDSPSNAPTGSDNVPTPPQSSRASEKASSRGSDDEMFYEPRGQFDSNGKRDVLSESEIETMQTPRQSLGGGVDLSPSPPLLSAQSESGGGIRSVASRAASRNRSFGELSCPDDDLAYDTCEDRSVKSTTRSDTPVLATVGSDDDTRGYDAEELRNSDPGDGAASQSSYAQLSSGALLLSSSAMTTSPSHARRRSSHDEVSSLSSASVSGGGGSTAHNSRQASQESEPPSFVFDHHEIERDRERERERPPERAAQTPPRPPSLGEREKDGESSSANANPAQAKASSKMSPEEERKVMISLFSLSLPDEIANGSSNGSLPPPARPSSTQSVSHGEHIFYTQRVKVSSTRESKACLLKDKLRLVQSLKPHDGAVWTMKFSPNGHYLASGGQDGKVLVWAVGKFPIHHERRSGNGSNGGNGDPSAKSEGDHSNTNNSNSRANGLDGKPLYAQPPPDQEEDDEFLEEDLDITPGTNALSPSNEENSTVDALKKSSAGLHIDHFVAPEPYRVFVGHTADVVDVSWSKSNFVLSASMDQHVRLWHVTRNDCLQVFRHPDVVTCVEFHPLVDRYFITGCFDRKLRVWDIIPDGVVREWTQATETITSIQFSPDGATVASGLIQGQIFFYEYEGLKYKTQIDCRNHNGKYKRGTKVTGMCFNVRKDAFQQLLRGGDSAGDLGDTTSFPPRRAKSTSKIADMLVTTNDSRIRYCRMEDYSFACKYKGLTNQTMQIKATFSDDGRFVISGSEDGSAYVWRTNDDASRRRYSVFQSSDAKRNTLFEAFKVTADDAAAVVAVFAPPEAVRHFVRAQDKLLSLLKTTTAIGSTAMSSCDDSPAALASHASANMDTTRRNTGGAAGGTRDREKERDRERTSERDSLESTKGPGGAQDPSCRVIATADSDGYIRFYFRLS